MGNDSALALKLLSNLNSRKKYFELKKQDQLLNLYSHKKQIARRNNNKPSYSPMGRGSSGLYSKKK